MNMDLVNKMFGLPQETHPERMFVLEQIGDIWGKTVIDVGCGNNKTLPDITGIDIFSTPEPSLVGSLDKIPYGNQSVDIIISRHSFEHVLDPVKALKEWKRVLKPGGRIVIVLPDHEYIDTMDQVLGNGKHLHSYTRKSFARLVELIGRMSIMSVQTVVEGWSFGMVIESDVKPPYYKSIIKLLSDKKPFAFVKRGDGEEACMRGDAGGNCDGSTYFQELGKKLREAYDYFPKQRHTPCFVPEFDDQPNYNIFLHRDDTNPYKALALYKAILSNKKHLVMVGPERNNRVAIRMALASGVGLDYCSIKENNAFLEYDKVEESLSKVVKDDCMVLFSCGMMAKPLIANLMKSELNNVTYIDIGSGLDPFTKQNRSHQISKNKIEALYRGVL